MVGSMREGGSVGLFAKADELYEDGLGGENELSSPRGFLEAAYASGHIQFRRYKDLKHRMQEQQQPVSVVLDKESVETRFLYICYH